MVSRDRLLPPLRPREERGEHGREKLDLKLSCESQGQELSSCSGLEDAAFAEAAFLNGSTDGLCNGQARSSSSPFKSFLVFSSSVVELSLCPSLRCSLLLVTNSDDGVSFESLSLKTWQTLSLPLSLSLRCSLDGAVGPPAKLSRFPLVPATVACLNSGHKWRALATDRLLRLLRCFCLQGCCRCNGDLLLLKLGSVTWKGHKNPTLKLQQPRRDH